MCETNKTHSTLSTKFRKRVLNLWLIIINSLSSKNLTLRTKKKIKRNNKSVKTKDGAMRLFNTQRLHCCSRWSKNHLFRTFCMFNPHFSKTLLSKPPYITHLCSVWKTKFRESLQTKALSWIGISGFQCPFSPFVRYHWNDGELTNSSKWHSLRNRHSVQSAKKIEEKEGKRAKKEKKNGHVYNNRWQKTNDLIN